MKFKHTALQIASLHAVHVMVIGFIAFQVA
nr:MAG TPA: hypothetical protein [Bacteriophage sp.]